MSFLKITPKAISKLLSALPKNALDGVQVVAFDTRIALDMIDSFVFRFIVDKAGCAASAIANALKKKGGNLLEPPEGFFVTGKQGPLKEGELERTADWAGSWQLRFPGSGFAVRSKG